MKIIDEKGKLFGFINIIDLAVLLVILLVIAGVIVKFVLPEKGTVERVDTSKRYNVVVKCPEVSENAILNIECRVTKYSTMRWVPQTQL
jgi:hypothetical protein